MNFRVALYRGKPVLTWWEGSSEQGLGVGEYVIADHVVPRGRAFPAGNGLAADLHEFMLTPQGTALVTSLRACATVDLSSRRQGRGRAAVVGGRRAGARDPERPRPLRVAQPRPRRRSPSRYAQVAGPLRLLPRQLDRRRADGDLLVSARNTWAVYKVNRATGASSGGSAASRATSRWATGRRSPGSTTRACTTAGDDHLLRQRRRAAVEPQSRAIVLALDTQRMRATLVAQYVHRPPLARARAGERPVASRTATCWSAGARSPYFTEYAADGASLRRDAPARRRELPRLPLPVARHARGAARARVGPAGTPARCLRAGTARPGSPPGGCSPGRAPARLAPAGTSPRQGFETRLAQPTGARFAAAVALGPGSRQLARTGARSRCSWAVGPARQHQPGLLHQPRLPGVPTLRHQAGRQRRWR